MCQEATFIFNRLRNTVFCILIEIVSVPGTGFYFHPAEYIFVTRSQSCLS